MTNETFRVVTNKSGHVTTWTLYRGTRQNVLAIMTHDPNNIRDLIVERAHENPRSYLEWGEAMIAFMTDVIEFPRT